MSRFQWKIPIRVKIVLLTAVALTASLMSYLYIGTNLMIDDKVSYIYDFNLTQVRSHSQAIETRIQKIMVLARTISRSVKATQEEAAKLAQKTNIEAALKENRKELGLEGIIILRPSSEDHFALEQVVGEDPTGMQSLLSQHGWTPRIFNQENVLVGTSSEGRIPLGVRAYDGDNQPLAFFMLFRLDTKSFESGSRDLKIHLMDALGRVLFTNLEPSDFSAASVAKVQEELLSSKFESGVQDRKFGTQDYIISYRRLAFNQMIMLGAIPKATAFSAARQLTQRSLALGVGILILSIGLTMLFVKSITTRLRQMWLVTKRVAEGDFSSRVNLGKTRSQDEVTDLATSFNAMADKIDELMVQTAEKARMEKELETAQLVQNRFFPHSDFSHGNLLLAGQYIPASECSGDWWHYAQVGNRLVVVIGDVTGHGVSSALVTAAAHGGFSLVKEHLDLSKSPGDWTIMLARDLNKAVKAAAQGSATMTCFIGVIELDNGMMTMVNASHRAPYVYRNPLAKTEGMQNCFKPLLGGKAPSLGDKDDFTVKPGTFQLEAGDMLFLYTDGLIECAYTDASGMNKFAMLGTIGKLTMENFSAPGRICSGLKDESMKLIRERNEALGDDMTFIAGIVPREVIWGAGPSKPAVPDAQAEAA
jgi:phosphoserine phosphatase RsbU/P